MNFMNHYIFDCTEHKIQKNQKFLFAIYFFLFALGCFGFGIFAPAWFDLLPDNVISINISSIKDFYQQWISFYNSSQESTNKFSSFFKRTYGQNQQPNIIVVFAESLSAIDSLKIGWINDNLPYFDKIQKEWITFTNFVANWCTSDTAHIWFLLWIEPLKLIWSNISPYSGYLTPTNSLPNFMNEQGYATTFVSSVSLDFLDQWTFLSGIWFSNIIGEEAFSGNTKYVFDAAPDHVLYNKTLQTLEQQKWPYFITLQTISFHKPYNTPYGKTEEEALRYSDKSLYYFYLKLKQNWFFDNGILIIMGDHRKMEPLEKNEKEALWESRYTRSLATIVGKWIPANQTNNNLIQHTDFFYSLKQFIGDGGLMISTIFNNIFYWNKKRNRWLVCCRNDYENQNIIVFDDNKAYSLKNLSTITTTYPFIYNYISSYIDFQYWWTDKEIAWNELTLIGHRWAPLQSTENSLEWFFLAKQQWANGIEFDVSRTKDNQNIVMHWEWLYSTICGDKKKVTNYTLDRLQKNCPLSNGETIRTLESILIATDWLFDYYFVEIKAHDPENAEQQTLDAINTVIKLWMQDKVIFISYDKTANYIIWSYTGIVAGRDTFDITDLQNIANFGHQYFLMPYDLITWDTVQKTVDYGKQMVTYTVNTTGELEQLYNQWIRMIMTDNIPLMKDRAENNLGK